MGYVSELPDVPAAAGRAFAPLIRLLLGAALALALVILGVGIFGNIDGRKTDIRSLSRLPPVGDNKTRTIKKLYYTMRLKDGGTVSLFTNEAQPVYGSPDRIFLREVTLQSDQLVGGFHQIRANEGFLFTNESKLELVGSVELAGPKNRNMVVDRLTIDADSHTLEGSGPISFEQSGSRIETVGFVMQQTESGPTLETLGPVVFEQQGSRIEAGNLVMQQTESGQKSRFSGGVHAYYSIRR